MTVELLDDELGLEYEEDPELFFIILTEEPLLPVTVKDSLFTDVIFLKVGAGLTILTVVLEYLIVVVFITGV